MYMYKVTYMSDLPSKGPTILMRHYNQSNMGKKGFTSACNPQVTLH